MPTIEEIRHANLLALIKEAGTIQALADKVGRSHSQLSQLKNQTKHSTTGTRRTVGRDLARELEAKCGKPDGWFDQAHGEQAAPAPAGEARIDLAQRLQSTRVAKRMTLEAAAECAGIPASELADIESGAREPSVWVMGDLAKCYGYTVDALLWESALSPEAVALAAEYDHMQPAQQAAVRTILLAFGVVGVSNADVEAAIPETRELRERNHAKNAASAATAKPEEPA